jgi:predicted phosphodiesterase
MIYFHGDVHGHFRHVREQALQDRPDAVVLLGDLEAQRPLEVELAPIFDAGIAVRWIRGNHDTDTKRNWDNLAGAMNLNIDGQVVELDGVRVAGLGGIFRGEIWYPDAASGNDPDYPSYVAYCRAQNEQRPARLRKKAAFEASLRHFEHMPGSNAAMIDEIRYGKELKHLSSIFWDVYACLWEQRADILVSHEAPSCHPHGFAAIDELAQAMSVKVVFHGHHHDNLDYRPWDASLGFKTYGVGFCGITDQTGRIVKSGDFDTARQHRQLRPF